MLIKLLSIGKRIREYARENFSEVIHTTFNPEGPGVVRIHMIPDERNKSIVIINGSDIIPVNTTWTILICEFIKEINKYDGKEITQKEYDAILNTVCRNVRKIYYLIPNFMIKRDLATILDTFTKIAYHVKPDVKIGYMNIGQYAPFMTAPHRMDLMVSAMTKDKKWHCNQKCVHCYAAGQKHSEEKELSTKQWKEIIDRCRKARIAQITFTGGEPTMREDLIELIDYSRWFMTRLNTNGINLTKEYCQKLKDASLDNVQITFYSSDEDIHNKLVGAKKYSKTVSAIENAIECGLSVNINTPLCTLNKNYLKTLKFLHQKGVIYVTCSGLITTGNAEKSKSQNLQLSKTQLKKILIDAVEFCNANGMEITFTSPGWIEKEFFEELNMNPPTCGACLSNMAVTPSGNVVPCQSWLSGETFGNMLKDDFKDIWQSEECYTRRYISSQMEGVCPLRKGAVHE